MIGKRHVHPGGALNAWMTGALHHGGNSGIQWPKTVAFLQHFGILAVPSPFSSGILFFKKLATAWNMGGFYREGWVKRMRNQTLDSLMPIPRIPRLGLWGDLKMADLEHCHCRRRQMSELAHWTANNSPVLLDFLRTTVPRKATDPAKSFALTIWVSQNGDPPNKCGFAVGFPVNQGERSRGTSIRAKTPAPNPTVDFSCSVSAARFAAFRLQQRYKQSCVCTSLLSPPLFGSPQVTTDPDCKMAANARPVAWMRWTFLSCSCTSLFGIPPGHNSPKFKDGRKGIRICLNLLDVPQLLLHLAAVSTPVWITPGHSSPRFQNGCKSTTSCLDVLDVPQLRLHLSAVSTVVCRTPGHNSPSFNNGSKSTPSCLDHAGSSSAALSAMNSG